MICTTTIRSVRTSGKGLYDLTAIVRRAVQDTGITSGLATIFLRHTSASLVIFENADPTAAEDLLRYFDRLVPDDATGFVHTAEGPDDMTSHIRMALTRTSESIPVHQGQPALGTWQGLFLFEHRRAAHDREVAIHISGTR